jgi:multidrug resistance efflux pump
MRLTIGRSLSVAAALFGFLLAATLGLVFLKVDRRVTIPGVFVYRDLWPVVVKEGGFVEEIPVEADSTVQEGQVILSLRNEELLSQRDRSQALLGIYEIELQQILDLKGFDTTMSSLDATRLREELSYLQERLQFRQDAVKSAKDLLDKKLGSQKSYEEAVLAYRAAEAEVSEIQIQLTQMDETLAELDASTLLRYELKKREYDIELDNLSRLEERISQLEIRADHGGHLLAEDLDSLRNAWLPRGTKVAEVVSYNDINFVGFARGTQVVRVAKGQGVYFNVELFRRKRFVRGTVARVGQKPVTGDQGQGFPIEIEVTDKRFFDRGRELFIQAGVPGEAVIVTEPGLPLASMVWERVINRLDPY